jgi:hypothetical protein
VYAEGERESGGRGKLRAYILHQQETKLSVRRERVLLADVVRSVENVTRETQALRRTAGDDGDDLRDLENRSSSDHPESESFREGVLEAVSVGNVEILNQGDVALLKAEGEGGEERREEEGQHEHPSSGHFDPEALAHMLLSLERRRVRALRRSACLLRFIAFLPRPVSTTSFTAPKAADSSTRIQKRTRERTSPTSATAGDLTKEGRL